MATQIQPDLLNTYLRDGPSFSFHLQPGTTLQDTKTRNNGTCHSGRLRSKRYSTKHDRCSPTTSRPGGPEAPQSKAVGKAKKGTATAHHDLLSTLGARVRNGRAAIMKADLSTARADGAEHAQLANKPQLVSEAHLIHSASPRTSPAVFRAWKPGGRRGA